jgi:predicted small metal-binding protein
MAKLLRCGDVVDGCPAEVRAESEEEVLLQAAEHARAAHGLTQLDEATVQKVKTAIRDGR